MEFRYLSVYKIQGIAQDPGEPDVLLVEWPDINTRVILTGDVATKTTLEASRD